jgi:hypothetical protein
VVRARGIKEVNFPLPGTAETQAAPWIAGGGDRARPNEPVPMPPGERYKGVGWFKNTGEWQVKIWNPDTRQMEVLQSYPHDQAEDAARFYDDAVRARGGTCVNFPQQGETQAHFGEEERKPGSTPFRGVSKKGKKYRAIACFSGEKKYLGCAFGTAEDAARACDKWLLDMGAPPHLLNFRHETSGAGAAGDDAAPARKRKRASPSAAQHDADVSSDAEEEGASDDSDAEMDAAETDAAAATPQPAGEAPSEGGSAEAVPPQARIAELHAALQASDAQRAQLAASHQGAQAHAAALAAELERTKRDAASAHAALAQRLAAQQARIAELERANRDATHGARNAAAAAAATVHIKRECIESAEAAAAGAVAAAANAAAAAAAAQGDAAAARSALEEATECAVCLDRARDTRFFDCRHRLCAVCGPQTASCPLCRSTNKLRKPQRVD